MNPAIYFLSGFTGSGKLLYAYSLRRVVSGYTGPGINVRKGSSTTVFQDFYFDSNGELDQAAILAFVGVSTAGYVRILYDQNGSGIHLGPAGAVVTREPRIVTPGNPSGTIITKNGKIAMSFVSGGFNALRTVTTLSHPIDNLSIFVVMSNSVTTGIQPCLTINNNTAVSETIFPRANGGTDYFNYDAGDRIVMGSTSADNKVYSSFSSVNYIEAFKNNTNLGVQYSIVNSAIGVGLVLGYNASNLIGTVQEILIYEGKVPNRISVTSGMMSYYNIL